jgi:ephrin-A
MQLTWDSPDEPNGVITKYEITYRVGDDKQSTDNSGLTTSYRISQLSPQTMVPEVTVSAYNEIGKGNVSRLMNLSTLEVPRK